MGGQALIEGVMMREGSKTAISVRTQDGIRTKVEDKPERFKTLKKIWFVRGVVALLESMVIGIKALNYSAEFYLSDVEETGFDRFLKKLFGKNAESIAIAITMLVSLGLAMLMFGFLPTFLTGFFKGFGWSPIALSVVESLMKIVVFLSYLFVISSMKDVKRVFQYHGAEHKSISNLESGKPLSVENARGMSRLHARCGTSFIFFVMAVSIVVFTFVSWDNIWIRFLLKLALLPVIAGISYEFIKLSNLKFFSFLKWPGMALQLITTKEPDDSQLEVALAALRAALPSGHPEHEPIDDMERRDLVEAV